MVVHDKPVAFDAYVFVRGDPERPGPGVPRQFISALTKSVDAQPFTDGSGRLKLAQAIVHPQNPLTARVIVNRVWQWHFGRGLVATPSDFGRRGDPPSHPELLDHLAIGLIDNGWSIKWLHREIMLSSVYRQDSVERGECTELDAGNRLLWKANRRRLEFESLRDAMLWTTGTLDRRLGGPATTEISSSRRSVYLFINRNRMSNTMSVFDLPTPDLSSPGRTSTISASQALFLMNSDFTMNVAEALANRTAANSDDRERITSLYRFTLSRDPNEHEIELGMKFIKHRSSPNPSGDSLSVWSRYAHALLQSNEFMFVD